MATNPQTSDLASITILGVDTGGTFTDFVLLEKGSLRIHKVLSSPDAPEQAILQGINEMGIASAVEQGKITIVHGSTVATNAALEGKGVKTALVCNEGFKDLLTIGRQTRRELYNLQPQPISAPVPPELCFEIPGRIDSSGQLLDHLSEQDMEQLRQKLIEAKVDAVAVNLLFSYLNPQPEQQIENALQQDWFTSISSKVLPESGEYERGIATWLNASLGPKVKHYLQRLQQGVHPSPLAIMQSTGGTIDAKQAGDSAVNMLLSGPAGGLAAAQFLGQQTGHKKLLTFDMGGTSTDVALVDGKVQLTNESQIGPWPVAVAQVDMHTIGAGGGSIAYCDSGGMLQVGPQSAGASPGPASYGKGGTQPTVTDANALLGRLQPEYFLGGNMDLDIAAAEKAMATLATQLNLSVQETALGIIRIANEHMVRALRVISIERGYHLDEFQLCCFGGAGGLHVCALADALEMKRAMVPNHGGVLSALGMVVADKTRQLSHGMQGLLTNLERHQIDDALTHLLQQGCQALQQEGIHKDQIQHHYSLDLRYQGQRFFLNIPYPQNTANENIFHELEQSFHQHHQQRYGHRLSMPVELVNIRCEVRARGPVKQLPSWQQKVSTSAQSQAKLSGFGQPVPVYWRPDIATGQVIKGPALIAETVSTTLVDNNWQAEVDKWGNLLLTNIAN